MHAYVGNIAYISVQPHSEVFGPKKFFKDHILFRDLPAFTKLLKIEEGRERTGSYCTRELTLFSVSEIQYMVWVLQKTTSG